jgi:hypothetical protein
MFDEHEPAEFELTPDLAAIERQLARMTPAAPRIDRDQLMFEAGKAASRPERSAYIGGPSRLASRFWPAATVLMTAACLFLATMLVWQRQSVLVVSQPPALPIPTTATDTPRDRTPLAESVPSERDSFLSTSWPANSNSGYLGVRNVALTRGLNVVDALTSAARVGSSEPTNDLERSQRQMLTELMPSS